MVPEAKPGNKSRMMPGRGLLIRVPTRREGGWPPSAIKDINPGTTIGNGNSSVASGMTLAASDGIATTVFSGFNMIVRGNGEATTTGAPGGYAILDFGNGDNKVSGTQGMAFITAGNGDDTIATGGSNNTINAGGGDNAMTGGTGNDRFILPTAGHGFDTISGFSELNGDLLEVHAALAATNWNGASATLANYLKVTASGGNTTLSVASKGTGAGAAITKLQGAGNLGLSDLLSHNSLLV